MRKIPDQAKSEIADESASDSKHAVLGYRVLASIDDISGPVSLLEIELETGRTHQIRLQCAERGFPILGDSLYGSSVPFGEQTIDLRKRQIALHARRLAFEHPIDHEPVDITAPLSGGWTAEQFAELFLTGVKVRSRFCIDTTAAKVFSERSIGRQRTFCSTLHSSLSASVSTTESIVTFRPTGVRGQTLQCLQRVLSLADEESISPSYP